jgi:Pyridoxamine 5'-phosphate oxidase
MRWSEFEKEQSGLAALGKEKLGNPGLVLIGTVRLDGSARISPVNPHFWDGDLCVSSARHSRKATDLLRDPRITVHNAPMGKDGSDGEFKVRGVAHLDSNAEAQQRFADTVRELYGWGPEVGTFNLLRVDIADVTFIDRLSSPDPNNPAVTRWSESLGG